MYRRLRETLANLIKADGRVLSFQLSSSGLGAKTTTGSTFDNQREQADRERRMQRTADPAVQDGKSGFSEQNNQPMDSRNTGRGGRRGNRGRRNFGRNDRNGNQGNQETGLYSDEMMIDAPPTGPKNRGNRRQ